MKELERAKKLKHGGDLAAALEAALEGWRSCRLAVVADAIDSLTDAALVSFEPPQVRKNTDFHRLWCELLVKEDPVTVGWLAKTLSHKLPGRSAEEKSDSLEERFKAIGKVSPDSRLAAAVTQLFDLDPPVMGLVPVREVGCQLLERFGDERTWAVKDRIHASGSEYTPQLDKIQDRLTPLADAERAGWIDLSGVEAKREEAAKREELLRAVLADPGADEPRAVLADWLMERGDPRGEFITLQLVEEAGEATEQAIARAEELLGEHKKEWLGDLRRVTYRAWFRRGFLWRLELDGSWRGTADHTSDPQLATVEELGGKATPDTYAKFITSPAMRSLRAIEVHADPVLKAIEAMPPGQIREVRSVGWSRHKYLARFTSRLLPLLESESAFPSLTTVGCDLEAYDALIASPLFSRLKVLELDGKLAKILPRWGELPQHIEALRNGWDGVIELRRGEEGTIVSVTGERCAMELGETLSKLPRNIQQIEIELPLRPEQYTNKRWGLDAAKLQRAAKRRKLPLTLRKQPRRSGKATGLY